MIDAVRFSFGRFASTLAVKFAGAVRCDVLWTRAMDFSIS
ncbi:hypothetical protein EMIT013CA1_50205 [Bacillus sp. IT-13CA1]